MKRNPLLDKIHREHELDLRLCRMVTRQEMMDMAMMALGRAYHFGPKMNMKFKLEMEKLTLEVAKMVEADTADKEYSIAKYEEELQHVCGEYYVPRAVRYGEV